jgi:Zn-dependent peptidase ImmA (M78 family)
MPEGFPVQISQPADVEQAAVRLREVWRIGVDPIENLTDLLEDKGIKVGLIDADAEFDACAFWAEVDGQTPFIVGRRGLTGDRQRFSFAHELAHLLLDIPANLNHEKVSNRFAGAFLAPDPAVRFELGTSRQSLSSWELHLLKHKYGLSMQAWIMRASDLGILSESAVRRQFQEFAQRGWRTLEPWDQCPPEEPTRFERLVMRALAEELISESKASELLGKALPQYYREVAVAHGGSADGTRS